MSTALGEDRCLDPDDLAAFMNGRLGPAGVRALEAHVARCAACRELLSSLARSESAIALAPTLAPALGSGPVETLDEPPLAPGAHVGRYVLEERLGAGGMGVVYKAHDPELDRHVALKLLRADAFTPALHEPLRERLRLEAQSMARLAHPNVVAVFDVGSFDGRIFIAMELVDGVTLSAWLASEPRPWQEIVAMFVQAGEGLAAAHAAGLVHRDFKPENVLIGADGRARVGDFGLARASAGGGQDSSTANVLAAALAERRTLTGSLVGTPYYMAPEQYLGHPVDPRTDQFSFCVAVLSSLTGQHPFDGDDPEALVEAVTTGRLRPPPRPDRVPGWLRRVLERGLAQDPEARHPSMAALLAALRKNPTRRLVLAGATVAALLVVGLGVAVAYRQGATAPALLCKGAEKQWDGVWDAARAGAIERAFAATGKPYAAAAFARVRARFDGYRRDWSAMATETCEAARVRGVEPEALHEKRMLCLDARWRDARALLDRLAQGDPQVVAQAPRALAALGDLATCADLQALASQVPLPASAEVRARVTTLRGQLAEVRANRVLAGGGKPRDAATALAKAAQATGYRPLEAEALYELGEAEIDAADYAAAEHDLDQAVWAAEAGRHDELEARAWTSLMRAKGNLGHEAEALTLRPRITAVLERLGGNDELAGAFHAASARMLGRTDEFVEAAREADLALAAYEKRFGPEDLHVADALDVKASVAIDSGHYAQAIGYRARALAIKEAALGPDHPDLGKAMGQLAEAYSKASQYREAVAMFKQALAFVERVDPPNHPDIAGTLYGFGAVYQRTGQFEEAIEMHRRSVEIARVAFGEDHPKYAQYLQAYGWALATVQKYQEALAPLHEALAITLRLRGPEHTAVASCLADLAEIEHYLKRHDDARGHLERAIAILEKTEGKSSAALTTALFLLGLTELDDGKNYPRALEVMERTLALAEQEPTTDPVYLAQIRYEVAEALVLSKGDRRRAVELARQARTVLATDPTQAVNLAKADRFLARWGR